MTDEPCNKSPKSGYVTLNGASTFIQRLGTGSPIVLVHPLGGSSQGLRVLRSELARYGEVITYDWGGHGRSEKPVEDYEMSDLGRDLADLVGLLHLGRVSMVGVAAGAGIAIQAALDWPGIASHLVLVSPCSEIAASTAEGMLARAAQVRREGMRSAVEASVQGGFSPRFRQTDREVIDVYCHEFLANSPDSYARASIAFSRFDATDRLGQLDAPCLLLSGALDPYFPPENSRLMAQRLSAPEVRVLEGVSHFGHLEAPRLIVEAAAGFL